MASKKLDPFSKGELIFDSTSLAILHSKSKETLLEFILARFEVYVSILSLYEFLSSVAYYKASDLEKLLANMEKIYHILYLDKRVILKASEIDSALVHAGIFLNQVDLLVASTAIVNNLLLVTNEPENFECIKKYGLFLISLDEFLEKIKDYLGTLSRQ
ncbi:MAG TPA: type II toxin-antitoxin system VapC family toxin [Thermofilum sp.]|nr:type II toxin-antitoxin system VapC family toxin [Thermofilum sp.]